MIADDSYARLHNVPYVSFAHVCIYIYVLFRFIVNDYGLKMFESFLCDGRKFNNNLNNYNMRTFI